MLLLCVLLGVIYATILYFREQKFSEAPKWTVPLLAFLRALSVTGIAALLLAPFLKSINESTQDPIIVVTQDQSSSMIADLSEDEVRQYLADTEKLNTVLSEKYETKVIGFGDDVTEGPVDSFTQKVTNLSAVIDYINNNYADQNLGAVVLLSDGIYNEGSNPIYSKLNMTAPIYTIASGDTTRRRDILVKNVFHNKIAYLGDKFSIQIDVQAINATGANSKLKIQQMGTGSTVLKESVLNITDNDYFTTIEEVLEANQTGTVKYRISVSGIANESTTSNNYKDIYVEILDAKQKILLLAHAPHPDLGAMQKLILTNKNYEVDIKYAENTDYNISDYNVVVLHNLPSSTYKIQTELDILAQRKISTMFIVGAQSDLNQVSESQDIVDIEGASSSLEDIQGSVNQSFTLFTTTEDLQRKLSQFPPLTGPFGEYTSGPTAQIYVYQKISKIDTEYPLLGFSNTGGRRTGMLVGEGIWKWRLYDYLKHDNYEVTTELLNQSIQYLSLKDDKRKFRSSSTKNIYKENENIVFDAQLYNDNYELINDPEVSLSIKDQNGKEYTYNFSRSQNYYVIDAGRFPEGNYRYTSRTTLSGNMLEDKGRFSVQSIQLESFDLTARHSLLRSLSDKYGGKLYYPNQMADLANSLVESDTLKPIIYQSTKTQALLNHKWLFFILAGLLVLEWFVRRYMGSY